MEQQGKPQIPSLKDSQKPQVKIKGLQAGLSLFDRLKQFKKKDLAFITAGLGVLFMAPLAEHFMMAPESGQMQQGWDIKPSNSFGGGSSPFDRGVDGMAPGGPAGGGGDVITPLNVRDPSALVMGPGAQQQPAATSTTPPPAPPKSEGNDWKDAIANAAATGVKEAVKKASLPVPKPSLTNAGLRGLGAVSGGGGGSYSAPSSAGLASGRAADSKSLQSVQSAPGFRGAAGPRGSNNASAGSMEALKKAANGAVDSMNRGGSGSSAAEQAAAMAMGNGSSGGDKGAGGEGSADKASSGSQNKDSSSVGESLEFLRRKAEQDKAIDLKWKLKEKQAMMWPNLKEKIAEEMVMTPVKGLMAGIGKGLGDWGGDKSKAAKYNCDQDRGIPASKVGKCAGTDEDNKGMAYVTDGRGNLWYNRSGSCTGTAPLTNCKSDTGSDTGPGKTEGNGVANLPWDSKGGQTGKNLAEICKALKDAKTSIIDGKPINLSENSKQIQAKLVLMVANVSGAQTSLVGSSDKTVCDGKHEVDSKYGNLRAMNRALTAKYITKGATPLHQALSLDQTSLSLFKGDAAAAASPGIKPQADPIIAALDLKTEAGKTDAFTKVGTFNDATITEAKKTLSSGGGDIKEGVETLQDSSKDILKELGDDLKTMDGYVTAVEGKIKEAKTQSTDIQTLIRSHTVPGEAAMYQKYLTDVEALRAKAETATGTDEPSTVVHARARYADLKSVVEQSTTKVVPEVETKSKAGKALIEAKGATDGVQGLTDVSKAAIAKAKMPTNLDIGDDKKPREEPAKLVIWTKEVKPARDALETNSGAVLTKVTTYVGETKTYDTETVCKLPTALKWVDEKGAVMQGKSLDSGAGSEVTTTGDGDGAGDENITTKSLTTTEDHSGH